MDSPSGTGRNARPTTGHGKDLLRKVDFEADEQIFSEDEPATALYVVDSGSIRLTRRVHSARCRIGSLGVGDVLGEAALFGSATYSVTAVTLEPTRCLRVQGSQFGEMVRRSPDIAFRFMKKLAIRLVHSQFRLSNFALRTPMARLMHQLLAEAERAGGETEIPLPFDLPEVLSLERGAVDDLVRRLMRQQLISVGGEGTFTIEDIDGFERYLTFLELHDRFAHLEHE